MYEHFQVSLHEPAEHQASICHVPCARHEGRLSYGHVSYSSRHLAQDDHLKETKMTEELEKAKSTIRQVASALYLILKDTLEWGLGTAGAE
jgi:hypothetical protein